MYSFLKNLDRRWVFLLMGLAVAIPILTNLTFPEETSPMVEDIYNAIEDLPDGSRILMAYDYDPGSMGELQPMAKAFTRQCAEKNHKLYYMALWPLGEPMIDVAGVRILMEEYPHYKYGEDYVNLGFKPGAEAVITVIVTDMQKLFITDQQGTSFEEIPMCQGIKNIQQMDLIVSISAGDPGTKQWVQYAGTPHDIPIVAGVTGVQATQLVAYIPDQLIGLLGAIKGAAEYEQILDDNFPAMAANPDAQEAKKRMGPQLVGHALMVALIIMGNIIYFVGRRRGEER